MSALLRDDLSIVIQGPIYNEAGGNTFDTIRSYREIFPKSHIILSTWIGSKIPRDFITDIGNMEVVYCIDPGPDQAGDAVVNLNRQIVSTAEGLKRAKTKYVLKTRTDAKISSDIFLHSYKLHLRYQKTGFIFKQPVVIYSLSTRNWRKGFIPHLFHPCDWFYFGLTEDVQRLFDIPLMSHDDLNYFVTHERPRRPSFCGTARYTPEQYILVAFLIKNGHLSQADFEHYAIDSRACVGLNEKIFKNDFLVLDRGQIDIFSWKYPDPHNLDIQISQLRHAEWVEYLNIAHMPLRRSSYFTRKWMIIRYNIASRLGIFNYYRRQK